MTLAVVQNIYGAIATPPSQFSVTVGPISTTPGNLFHFAVDIVYPGVLSAADVQNPHNTGGDIWAACQAGYGSALGAGNASSHCKSYAWYAKNIAGNAADYFTIDAAFAALQYVRVTIIEIAGADLTAPLDITNNGIEVVQGASVSFTSGATSAADEIVIGHMGENIGVAGVTLDSNFTAVVNGPDGTYVGSRVVSATGTQNMTNTVSGANSSYGFNFDITTYKAAAGGTPPQAWRPRAMIF